MAETQSGGSEPARFSRLVRGSLAVVGVVAFAALIWHLSEVLLLFFGAVVVGVILRSSAGLIERHSPIRTPWSLVLAVTSILLLFILFFLLLGWQIAGEVSSLAQRFPEMIAELGSRLGVDDLPQRVGEQAGSFLSQAGTAGKIANYTSVLLGVLANVVLVLVAGIYLAARSQRYRSGILKLAPPRWRERATNALDNSGRALRLWLLGQLISMAVVGVLVTAGLYLIGMPSALALGFLAGLSEFVPIVGPILSAVPALLLAHSEGQDTIFWVLGLYLAVQQVESNLIMPLVQRKTVDIPPVLTLFAILALGTLFGPLGVLLGTPLTVVLHVLVIQLYLRDTLGEDVPLPGGGG